MTAPVSGAILIPRQIFFGYDAGLHDHVLSPAEYLHTFPSTSIATSRAAGPSNMAAIRDVHGARNLVCASTTDDTKRRLTSNVMIHRITPHGLIKTEDWRSPWADIKLTAYRPLRSGELNVIRVTLP